MKPRSNCSLDPILQTLLGTLITWGLTAAGAACVFVLNSNQRKILDGSLGFAAGVMLAASFWSLLKPSLEIASESFGALSFIPVTVGFIAGGLFVYLVDILVSEKGTVGILLADKAVSDSKKDDDLLQYRNYHDGSNDSVRLGKNARDLRWKRVLLLIIAITVHNIPEGLAVGVGFGATATTQAISFSSAANLVLGIGVQNFPEGLAVSLPLRAAGFSKSKAFWYGQLSGSVEPLFGILGCLLISYAQPMLPYSLAFAAGAMVFVVLDDIVPESQACGNGKTASWSAIIGFIIMMALEVGLEESGSSEAT
ncbi:zinc transporter ZIP11-like isoform X2 [Varroa jacobsoni]|uniref:Zinc transporter ZIP11 n=1 Tax=Varroa destructor TaxID=109461 RepID=A0A7M7JN19_VARDE|nr:zinc transporter ZIP11-like isoform X2 [Varroa destructor]XP_022686229.1 zinc transporter ZIP11-like isoform X2 [Varroa jacobsoni]